MTKRLDFPYSYYNQRLAEKAFKGFALTLRKRWIKQKYNIMVNTLIDKKNERLMAKVFVKLCHNVFHSKKKQYLSSAVDDFRKDILLTKAFKAFKLTIGVRYRPKQIVNYCTENIHDYDTRDAYLTEQCITESADRRRIQYDANTCMFNPAFSEISTPLMMSSQNNAHITGQQIEELKSSQMTDKDEILEQIVSLILLTFIVQQVHVLQTQNEENKMFCGLEIPIKI